MDSSSTFFVWPTVKLLTEQIPQYATLLKNVGGKRMPFPEPVHYSRTDSPGWMIRDWETANKLLSYLEPERRHFAVFTLPDNSYVQCLGAKTALTIEVREQHPDGTFTHWVFGKGPPVGQRTRVGPESGSVSVDRSQLLTMRDARLIIREFLESRTLCEHYYRQDVTRRFTETEDGSSNQTVQRTDGSRLSQEINRTSGANGFRR